MSAPQTEQIAQLEAELARARAEVERARHASSEAVLRGVLEATQCALMILSPVRDADARIVDFVIERANPKSEAMIGVRAETMVGRRLLELFPGNANSAQVAMYVEVIETGKPGRTEAQYHEGGIDLWCEVAACLAGDWLAVSFFDISESRRAEQALLARSAQLAHQKAFAERIIENVMTGICYFDRELIFRLVNQTYCGLMGRPREELLGRHAYEIVPGSAEATLPLFRAVLDRGETHAFKAVPFTLHHPETGEHVTYWDATYLPMKALDSDVIEGILVLCDEVSDRVDNERLQAERIEVLETANRHKEEFLSILSHELRTPINAIMGFTSVLDDELAGPLTEDQHGYLGKILDGTDRMLALINDLLDMSRIQAGKFHISLREVNLVRVAEDTIASLKPLADMKRLNLMIAERETPHGVQADPQRLEQVLTNLLGNAIKFTPDGGTIAVAIRRDGGDALVEVRDTGIGIPTAEQARIFDAFTQVDMSNTRRAGGTGLGLAIARSLIEAHGGSIGVRSIPGQGATFWFRLPIETPRRA